MSLIDKLGERAVWEKFYEYKLSLSGQKNFVKELREFIDSERYLPVAEAIRTGRSFPLPFKSVISKTGTEKKRTVYTYPDDENTVLKLLTWLILRKYDYLFAKGLYSFRPMKTAKDAVRYLLKKKEIFGMYSYKADIYDYFNSVPVEKLIPMLKYAFSDDDRLFGFTASLLLENSVIYRGRTISEKKGIMAGTPLSSFYANLFLSDLDRYFFNEKVPYARYSDDIILFAGTAEKINEYKDYIRSFLAGFSLEINPKKELVTSPGEGFVFLGFSCMPDKVDIAPVTVKKLKKKMKRKSDSLVRWRKKNDIPGEKAARAFIRIFNRKLLEGPRENELCWSSWFFPVINSTSNLYEIDHYAQDCIRYILSEKHTKSRFNYRYEYLKTLGYRSLVNAYYSNDRDK